MPKPTASLSTLRPDIAGSLEEFDLQADRAGFIAQQILPTFEVATQAGTFGKIPIEQLLQNHDTERAPGSGYSRGKFTFTTDSFATQEYGWEEPIDDRESAMYQNYLDAEMVAGARARDFVLRDRERRVAALIFNSSTWTGSTLTTAVSTEWSTVATATPINDVLAACYKVFDLTGLWPNALICSRKVYLNLRRCAQITDKVQYVQGVLPGQIGVAELQSALDLPYIIVGGGANNTANIGQTAAIAEIWDDEYAMVARICTGQDIREPGLGRTMHWGEDGSTIGTAFETYRDETIRGNVVRARFDVQEKVLYAQAAHLLSNITA